ncbi:MAG TPA: response regulator transcription factor, partial [Clostridiaceae bacterium]|nr:response regulator transcription factor [Clostridiaceae bacterium]
LDPTLTQQIFIEHGLTNRECHVALKLPENISNKEIASQLYISGATVKNTSRIFIKSSGPLIEKILK